MQILDLDYVVGINQSVVGGVFAVFSNTATASGVGSPSVISIQAVGAANTTLLTNSLFLRPPGVTTTSTLTTASAVGSATAVSLNQPVFALSASGVRVSGSGRATSSSTATAIA